MSSPNKTELTIRTTLTKPSVENDNLIKMVETMKPELRMTVWNLLVRKKEKRSRITSTTIKIVKN